MINKAFDELRQYLAQRKSDDPKAPVFHHHGRDGIMNAVLKLLNGMIRKRLKIDDPTLVSYSTRHKIRTDRATAELQHSILGHGTRTDADGYPVDFQRDNTPLEVPWHLLIRMKAGSHIAAHSPSCRWIADPTTPKVFLCFV